jgi:hypothetical protein
MALSRPEQTSAAVLGVCLGPLLLGKVWLALTRTGNG